MKREEKKKKENIEKLGEVLEEKKKLPKEVKDKINAKVFENMAIAVVFMIYLAALNLGMNNIPTENYLLDLKVFSMLFLVITIIIFEVGLRKDNAGIWLHGVETIVLAAFTLYLVYLYSIYYTSLGNLIVIIAIVYLVYYAIKLVIIQRRMENEYNKTLTDVRKIVKNKL